MEHTAAAPSRARGYQSGTSRHIERADPEMAAPAPSRASEQTPWSVTRGVVAGVAFGALVIAGGALVAAGLTSPSGILARLGSSQKPEVVPTDADALFSLPSFKRDGTRAKPAVADLGRAAAETRREEVSKRRAGDRKDAWGIEKTRAESSLGKKSLRGGKADLDADLESDAGLFEATLVFAKPRPEDERERRARSSAARKTNGKTSNREEKAEKAEEDDALDLAIADELSDLAELDAAEIHGDAAFEDETTLDDLDETLDDLFEPADVSAASAQEQGALSLDALAAGAASEIGEAREDAATEPDDSAATEPDDSAATEPGDSAATEPDDSAATDPDDSAAPDPEDPNVERKPNIVPGMTYEEEQAEYARFAEEEAARNDAIAAEAARANAEAESAAAAGEGALPTDAAKEAFEAEEAQRRAEFEAVEARRRAEFEARTAQGGEAELGEELDSIAAEAPAEGPEPFFFSESEGFFAETFAEAPAFSSPFFESENFADAPAAEPARVNPDLPFPYSFQAATPTVTPSEKDTILRSAANALGPVLRETAAQALEEYAKRLREEQSDDASFTFPDASFASGEEVADAIDESFEEVVPPAYGAGDANATSAGETTETEAESETTPETPETPETETETVEEVFLSEVPEEVSETETVEEVSEEVPEEVSLSPSTDAEAPASSAEPAEAFAEDEVGSFEEAFAFAPAESEALDEVAFAPAPAESEALEVDAFAPEPSEPEDDALAFLLAEGASGAISASLSLPDDDETLPEVPTESSEAADAAEMDDIDAIYDAVDDVSAVTQRLEAALGAASHARDEEKELVVGGDGVIVLRETKKHSSSKKAKKDSKESSSSKSTHSSKKKSSKTSSRLTKAERARGWSDGDETVLRSLSKKSDAKHSETVGSLTPRRVHTLSGSVPGGDADPAWATIGATSSKRSSHAGKSASTTLERSLAVSAEEAAAAAAAADEEALRVDTTLDAVQQAIAEQRRDDAPAATLYLAPLSVVGLAGVVVIAILLVRHRDPRGTRRDGSGDDGETASLLGGERERLDGDSTGAETPADALLKTSNANLRAFFGSVGDFGKERVFATPSETDNESAAESVGARRRASERGVAYEKAKESSETTSSYGVLASAFDRARKTAEAAERFSSSRVSALRASVERTARMAWGEDADFRLSAAAPRERAGGATPATASSAPSTPRGEPAATVLDVAGEIPATQSAFSAAEMRRAEEKAWRDGVAMRSRASRSRPPETNPLGNRSPPSSFVDPVSAPGSPERRNVTNSASRPAVVSEEARRRFQQAAATSAHARAFAAPPRPHLANASAGGSAAAYERSGSKNAVMGAGRAVAPAPEGPPAMVKSTTRFL